MGAHQSVYAGKAKLDVGVNLIQKLYSSSNVLSPLRTFSGPFSLANGSLCLKLPTLFGNGDLLDVSWHKGLHDSNLLINYRTPRPPCLGQRSLNIVHSLKPEIGIHGIPVNNFCHSASGDVKISKLSIGLDMNEPSSYNWKTTTSVHFKHIHFINDCGRSVSRDLDGFPLTLSGNSYDNMVVISQESRFEEVNDHKFSHYSFRVEQGIPIHPNLAIFNRFKFSASKGVKIGSAFFSTLFNGGSLVGATAPYEAFAIGGPNSVRGYGEGAVGSGYSSVVSKNEFSFPLDKQLTGVVFLDFGSDLRSSNRVLGNPGLRKGKPGSGIGIGYGIRFKTELVQITADCAINAFKQRTLYFGINNLVL
ncbi:hypothetical protein HN51_021570 [Arachis hypogaea]|uniref:outer envelope protein 39, chloroplastic-like isoform X1 n=1 Tax=Arachis hypogaea TaxID=3818 RepID=UPI000DEC37E9|nr:Outer envelope protein [Arachis hypogaea]